MMPIKKPGTKVTPQGWPYYETKLRISEKGELIRADKDALLSNSPLK